ncbi:fringe glycosyltransferase isoform X1 [Rhynchophorus ferrugineus]|uniref:fringe glycosyltransferase isoform X1 n=1 Tax=Rhynchophorus ferrugineus TaxID=354439 RepID=UPI003FCD24B0
MYSRCWSTGTFLTSSFVYIDRLCSFSWFRWLISSYSFVIDCHQCANWIMNRTEEIFLLTETKKMHFRHRKLFQTLTCVVLFLYSILVLYHSFYKGVSNAQNDEAKSKVVVKKHVFERTLAQESSSYDGYSVSMSTEIPSATATVKPPTITLDDVFISVKTTRNYHNSRLPIILKTWFQLAKKQTWFFTDSNDADFQARTNGHMINTNCSSSHNRKALCCKMSVEFDTFLNTDKKWFCHFDDDNYVNVPRLVKYLADYNPIEDWYLGKPSIQAPLEIVNKDRKAQKVRFWFATGGAGFCLSRALALKMIPLARPRGALPNLRDLRNVLTKLEQQQTGVAPPGIELETSTLKPLHRRSSCLQYFYGSYDMDYSTEIWQTFK